MKWFFKRKGSDKMEEIEQPVGISEKMLEDDSLIFNTLLNRINSDYYIVIDYRQGTAHFGDCELYVCPKNTIVSIGGTSVLVLGEINTHILKEAFKDREIRHKEKLKKELIDKMKGDRS